MLRAREARFPDAPRAARPRRNDRRIRLLLAAAVIAVAARPAVAATIGGALGAGFAYPRSNEISSRYGGALALDGCVELRFAHPLFDLGVDLGYRRSTASLSGPPFVTSARGTMTAIPIDLVARVPLSSTSPIRPHVGLGFELLRTKETFSYRVDAGRGDSFGTTRDPGADLHPGLVFVAGFDRTEAPRLRIEGVMSFVNVTRSLSTGATSYEAPGAATVDAGTYAIRVSWRIP